MAAVNSGQAVLERDDGLGRIDRHLRDAIAGRGSLLLLEGQAGIGKTSVVLEAVRRGRELGMATLSARGSELEQDFAYGLVRELFEAPVVAGGLDRKSTRLYSSHTLISYALFFFKKKKKKLTKATLNQIHTVIANLHSSCVYLR